MTAHFENASPYHVELFCRSQPQLDRQVLFSELRKYCPNIEPFGGDEVDADAPLAFVHPDHQVLYRDGSVVPAQVLISVNTKLPDAAQLTSALQQSWRLNNAAEVVASCTSSVLVTDLMASGLKYQTRFDLFQRVLRAVLALVPSRAIYWFQAEQIVGSDDFMAGTTGNLADLLLSGPINVRLFNIESGDGQVLMDTRGLSAFGLPDVQCHFRGLDCQAVAKVLYDTAFYIFERGDAIEDGHTVPGVAPSSKWRCRHVNSLVGPDRIVLDLNPGVPYAAGGR